MPHENELTTQHLEMDHVHGMPSVWRLQTLDDTPLLGTVYVLGTVLGFKIGRPTFPIFNFNRHEGLHICSQRTGCYC